ncbi:hypothetical protein MtrunA17_Chr6g0451151 [Medicago truncatula]|uniref:Uncharacterized protein n=1 Tax=Medicago truncatula TaxID=3880 RepID=A0A396HBE8_MEDTR|nr:hypothetical protein MtrunA17_Chr6g0451151 [Medicago truncatula]
MSFHGDISNVSTYNTQNTNMSLQQGISGGANISKPGYSSSSPLMFGIDGKAVEVNPNIGDAILHGVDSNLSNAFNNGGSSSGIIDMSFHGDISSVPYNTQNTNMSLQQGISWGANISKPRYSSSSPLMFGADGKVAGVNPNIGDAYVTPITNVEPNSRSVNGAILDHTKTSSNELLSRNFSFPEESSHASLFLGSSSSPSLTGVLDDYPRPPPFLNFDDDNLLEILEKVRNCLTPLSIKFWFVPECF